MANDIYLYNTLTKKKELFIPITAGHVGMYHCGPTVYNYPHIGNLRSFVLADTLRRTFEASGYKVKQVINITDVGHLTASNDEGLGDDGEDKVEKMAKTSGKSALEIAEYYTTAFFNDIKSLNIKTADTIFPKASLHIREQINLILILEKKGLTYKTSDGIYFNTSKFPDYGKLGNINLTGLEEGARIGVNDEKRNLTDFALWKFSKTEEKRFQEWESPWGVGYPGWHIECSAMSLAYLGETFDIHTGGIDHIPVHHNNEIAQSECAHNGKPLAHYWLHNAFVNSDGKMSKSKGDFIRLTTLQEMNIAPMEYRFWLLQAQYHSQVQYTEEAVRASATGYKNLVAHIAHILTLAKNNQESQHTQIDTLEHDASKVWLEMLSIMQDDLNTPGCIAKLWSILKDDQISPITKLMLVEKTDTLLGLELISHAKKHNELFLDSTNSDISEYIKKLLDERLLARKNKEWKKSDEIRDTLKQEGYEVLDTEGGQILKKI